MRQVFQDLKTGETNITEVPRPSAAPGQVLIRSHASLVSTGTERMMVEFGKAGFIDKARQQPDKVRQVLEKIRTNGLMVTVEAVRSKLDEPLPMGYCNVGTVIGLGAGVRGFVVGDRVASNGRHAEFVAVPAHLCAKVHDAVGDEAAAFTVLGAIALQGMRLAEPTLGEGFVVSGLGLIGLLTVQLLRAQGCRVLGLDFDVQRLALARQFGAETVDLGKDEEWAGAAQAFSRGRGVDGVLVTASTASDEPISQAAKMCRKRGRIVLVGVTGLNLSRADFYEKELSFQVSCSYGPGRYDVDYEQNGHDYPVGFVRWTEQRNFEAILDMLGEGKIDTSALVSHRFAIAEAAKAYETIVSGEPSLGVLLRYPDAAGVTDAGAATVVATPAARDGASARTTTVGFIGAGNYASRVLLPVFKKAGATVKIVASASGASAGIVARRLGVALASSDVRAALDDPEIGAVVIATRHDSHAALVCDALRSGKHVFVEKPLCLTLDELAEIEATLVARPTQCLMVGFNRRFAPHVQQIKTLLDRVAEPKSFVMTVNAGAVPPNHWVQDKAMGGGRVLGEGCHFVDLLRHLAGAEIIGRAAVSLGRPAGAQIPSDNAVLTLQFADGSVGTIHYLANGHKGFAKERLEVFCGGRVLQLDNFRRLTGWGWKGFSKLNLWRHDKGVQACVEQFLDAVRTGGVSPVSSEELIEVSRVAIELQEMLR